MEDGTVGGEALETKEKVDAVRCAIGIALLIAGGALLWREIARAKVDWSDVWSDVQKSVAEQFGRATGEEG